MASFFTAVLFLSIIGLICWGIERVCLDDDARATLADARKYRRDKSGGGDGGAFYGGGSSGDCGGGGDGGGSC